MNVNEFNVRKRTLFLCLHNYFLKELIPQYFSAVTHAVTPKEIGRRSFASMPSFLFHFCYLYHKRQTAMSHLAPHKLHLIVKASFPSTFPA